jgi:hypothetical protein
MGGHAAALVLAQCFMKKRPFLFGLFVITYAFSYFLLMARNVPAVDRNDRIQFRSSFRMAAGTSTVMTGGVTTIEKGVTFLNYIFYPMDMVYYRIAPDGMSSNTMPVQ